jgi:hypothetical protein
VWVTAWIGVCVLGNEDDLAVGVAGRECSVGGGGFGERVAGGETDAEIARFGEPGELERGCAPDLGSGVGPGCAAKNLEAQLEASRDCDQGDDPIAVGDKRDRRVDRFVAADGVDGGVDPVGGKSADPLEQPGCSSSFCGRSDAPQLLATPFTAPPTHDDQGSATARQPRPARGQMVDQKSAPQVRVRRRARGT